MKKLLIASGEKTLIEKIEKIKNYEIIGVIGAKELLASEVRRLRPDILLITEGVKTVSNIDTVSLLISTKQVYPEIRIVYLAGAIDYNDKKRINHLGNLVLNDIYDIYHEGKMTISILQGLLDYEKSKEDSEYLLRYHNGNPDSYNDDDGQEFDPKRDTCNNLIMISSIKPGSGKSFIATSLATAIAKYGRDTPEGGHPKVAIIEGDLQTLSIGTILGIEDSEKNLTEALKRVSKIVDETGLIIGSDEEIVETKEFISTCFLKYDECDNLYVLAGSQLSLDELNNINSYQYYMLVQLMSNEFDVMIVDTNSSLEHRTTGALLELANTCYYILDLDYNNIRNNTQYKKELDSLGVSNKISYILNRDISEDHSNEFKEDLVYTANQLSKNGFDLAAKIPLIDITVMYNRLHRATPLILDDTEATFEARKELLKVANKIWPIDAIDFLAEEQERYYPKKKKKKRFIFF